MDLEQVRASEEAINLGDMEAASIALRRSQLVNDRLGLGILRRDEDSVVVTMDLSEEVEGNAPGTVHGGMLATFADIASAMALHASFDEHSIPVTTDMHIRYYRQPKAGPLTAKATVVHRGRQLLGTECRVADAQNRVLARATATYVVVPFGA
jgi:uncharacterized protein (TIGR00369 family)